MNVVDKAVVLLPEWLDCDPDLPQYQSRVLPAWGGEQGAYLASLLEGTAGLLQHAPYGRMKGKHLH